MEMEKINKAKARKLYHEGVRIYLIPSKIEIDWASPYVVDICITNHADGYVGGGFNTCVNSYEFYNCTSKTGKYAHFYIEESLLKNY